MQQFSDSQLAGDYKSRGIDRQSSYSHFVRDRNLKPSIDAAEFFKIYDAAIAVPIQRFLTQETIEGMTHILIEIYSPVPKRIKLLEEHETHIKWVTNFGMTGSTRREFVESLTPID
jgi:hypothetical protein